MFGGNMGGFGGGGNSGGGSPFGGGAGGFGGGNSDGGASSGGPMGGAPNTNTDPNYNYDFGDAGGGSDMMSQLSSSPFGRLLDLPGIDGPEDIFGNVGVPGQNPFGGGAGGEEPSGGNGTDSSTGGETPNNNGSPSMDGGNPFGGGGAGGFGGGGSPFGGGAGGFGGGNSGGGSPFGGGAGGGENPWAGWDPLTEGNPLVEGDEPNVSFPGGDADSDAGGLGSLPDTGEVVVGDDESYIIRSEDGEWLLSDDAEPSDDDTSISNPDVPGVSEELLSSGGNPFGGNPFEFDPTAALSDSSDIPGTDSAAGIFPVGQVPEGLSNEELAVSTGTPVDDAPAASDSPWVWDFGGDGSFGDGSVELNEDGQVVLPNDVAIPLFNEEGELEPPVGGPVGSAVVNNEGVLEIPGGINVPLLNEEGEFELPVGVAPVLDEEGGFEPPVGGAPALNDEGELEIPNVGNIPLFNEEGGFEPPIGGGAPALNDEGELEFAGGFELPIFGEEGELELPVGPGAPVAGEDGIQFPVGGGANIPAGEDGFEIPAANPFLEGSELAIPVAGGAYLLNDEEGNWFLSSDEAASDDDSPLQSGAAGIGSFGAGINTTEDGGVNLNVAGPVGEFGIPLPIGSGAPDTIA
ncbi:MAG: hypothetical protein ACFB4I_10010 [Cyanophyceae cyanobacterium]